MNGVFKFSMQIEPSTLYEKRMMKLVMCQAHMIRCMEAELWTARSRFINLQYLVEPYVRMTTVPYTVLYYPQGDDATMYEVTEYPYRYPEAQGVRVPQSVVRPSRMSVGLLVRHMARTTYTPTDLLGDTPMHLLHPKAPRCDGDPATYLLPNNHFLVDFRRPPYDSPTPTLNMSHSEDMSRV